MDSLGNQSSTLLTSILGGVGNKTADRICGKHINNSLLVNFRGTGSESLPSKDYLVNRKFVQESACLIWSFCMCRARTRALFSLVGKA